MTSPTFIVVGAGIAGLNTALKLSELGHVLVLTKNSLKMSNTYLAQGGFSALINKLDSAQQYEEDTLKAGAYHNNKKAVSYLVKKSKKALKDLIEYGVKFHHNNQNIALTQEGGHSIKRIAYAGDFTGREIVRALMMQVKKSPNITILEQSFVYDLIISNKKCLGLQVIHNQKIQQIYAPYTIIASGGVGRLYKHTTNFLGATADGLALALEHNINCEDLEFLQFHPTALKIPGKRRAFLISEVLRGEGAILINKKGERFMKAVHEMAELAPRHLVSQHSFKELKKGPIYLKFRGKKKAELEKRFPTIYHYLTDHGFALEKDLIPVSPVMHYACGGIATNLKAETSLTNLYAVGEVSYTGIHGANRLASNSLLEGIVFSNALAESFKNKQLLKAHTNKTKNMATDELSIKEKHVVSQVRKKLQATMWKDVGIIRNPKGLEKALTIIKSLEKKIHTIKNQKNQRFRETQNMITAAKAITKAALKRKESLGTHYIQD